MAWQPCAALLRALLVQTECNTVRMYGVSLEQLLNWNSHLYAASSSRTQTRHTPIGCCCPTTLTRLCACPRCAAQVHAWLPWLRVSV